MLRESVFAGTRAASGETMTIEGTINKALILFAILLAGVLVEGISGPLFLPLVFVGLIGGFVLALVTAFRPAWAPILAPMYAFLEGLFLGGISFILETAYPGVVVPAIALTFGVFAAMLLVYRSRIITVTDRFRLAVVSATAGIAIVYLVNFALILVGVQVPLLHEAISGSGWLGIAVSLVVIAVASLNLILDFDAIEQGAAAGAARYMEWYGAFALMVTLVWLYLEILRLLAKLRRR